MALSAHRGRGPGKVFGLLAAAFALSVVVIALLGEFGLPDRVTAVLVIMITVVVYAVMGVVARTLSLSDFYVAGRTVSAGFNGMATAAAMLASAGFLGIAGAFYAGETAGLALSVGWAGGLAVLAIAVAPYYRKSGAVTLPDFLAVRFGNPLVRILGIVVLLACSLPLLAAAIVVAGRVAGASLHIDPTTAVAAVCMVLLFSSLFGGMRGVTLAAGAQAIVILIGVVTPALVYSLQLYGLPIPQLTYGDAMAQNALADAASLTLFSTGGLPDGGLDGFNLFALALSIVGGVVCLPHVLARSGTTRGIADARLSAGWALLVVAVVASTAPAFAAFAKSAILAEVVGTELADLPAWLFDYGADGLVRVCGDAITTVAAISTACGASAVVNGLAPGDIAIAAEVVTLGFADITGLPYVLTALIAAAVLAAALGTAGAVAMALGASAGHDFYTMLVNRRAPAGRRLFIARLFLILFVAAGGWLAASAPEDALAIAFASPSLAAAGFFPAVILGIWWRRTTFRGAAVGMIAGFGVTAAYVLMLRAGSIAPLPIVGLTDGLSAAAAAIFGVPIGLAVTVIVSLVGAAPSDARIAVVDAIRRPSPDPVLEDHAV
ncbi:VC_2705 family sodium/solute symporter [Bauldia litoralis]|uniref:VC_2705 family sodium/solute symporter n=1 Tax=Bauldia litoralis TaxID=665467 RepID=UPI00326788B3